MDVVSRGVLIILVAAARPTSTECMNGFGVVVPISTGGRRPGYQELADLAPRNVESRFIDKPDIVTGHRVAGCAVAEVVEAVREKDVQHLRRTDAVENW